MPKPQALHGWILARQPYRESSLILRLFTLEAGRIDVLVRGGRKQAHLQIFQPLWFYITPKTGLATLYRAEMSAPAIALQAEALWCGFYLNELITRLIPNGATVSPQFFAQYGATLEKLAVTSERWQLLRYFELALLDEGGFGVDLEHDIDGQPINATRYYRWQDNGLLPAANGYSGEALLAFLNRRNDTPFVMQTMRDLLRDILQPYLGQKPLQSRKIWRDMQSIKEDLG